MLTQYRYFAAIIDHGGVTAAAHALAISQPAISRSLQSLEFRENSVAAGVRSSGPTSPLPLRRRNGALLMSCGSLQAGHFCLTASW